MIRTGIRNIGINEDGSIHDDASGDSVGVIKDWGKSKLLRIINDRKILEFLFSHNGREILRKNGIAGLGDINIINHLDIISIAQVKSCTDHREREKEYFSKLVTLYEGVLHSVSLSGSTKSLSHTDHRLDRC